MTKVFAFFCMIILVAVVAPAGSEAKQNDSIFPVAIIGFEERGSGVKGYGNKVSDILFAKLVADPQVYLVERPDLKKIMAEQELTLSGMVTASQAIQVGQLTGAKILITGSVIEVDKTLYLVAKLIGTETSRILGDSIKGPSGDEIVTLAEALAEKVRNTLHAKASTIVAEEVATKDRIANIQKILGKAKRPAVMVSIAERHIGQATIDPAAETEMIKICQLTGFDTIDADTGSAEQADILITGEGFSEFANRRGNIVSVKARLEIKAVDRVSRKIVAMDRCTVVEIDLAEQIAGKTALQKAVANIAERLLPKLAGKENNRVTH